MNAVADVVVVGGGIAGASLAFGLASQGLAVTVLEHTLEYPDRVRGEAMMPWGVKEARALGVDKVLLDAGARVSPVWKEYSEDARQPAEIMMSEVIEGVPGALNMRHPDACRAIITAAADTGAAVVRGVRGVKIIAGHSVTVSYNADGDHRVTAPVVVGADGRASVVRRQSHIPLHRQDAICHASGLLVDGLDVLPGEHDVIATDGDFMFALFHQGRGRARVYLFMGESRQHQFSGHDAVPRFLAACDTLRCGDLLSNSTPAGPCATYPGDDTWTDTPYADGVVLIGDAAGYNDPVLAQGLSIALRDARIVRDLVIDGAREPSDFAPYGAERTARMERLRFVADVVAVARVEDADNLRARRAYFDQAMATRDPDVSPLLLGAFAGPETDPVRPSAGRAIGPDPKCLARQAIFSVEAESKTLSLCFRPEARPWVYPRSRERR